MFVHQFMTSNSGVFRFFTDHRCTSTNRPTGEVACQLLTLIHEVRELGYMIKHGFDKQTTKKQRRRRKKMKESQMYLLFATETLWRPDWNKQQQTSSSPAVPDGGRGHWCHRQTGEGPHTAPARHAQRSTSVRCVNTIFTFIAFTILETRSKQLQLWKQIKFLWTYKVLKRTTVTFLSLMNILSSEKKKT